MNATAIQLKPALKVVSPLKEVWTIAWPTVLTMTSYTLMQFTDKLMVGQVGPVELAAQTNGGLWSFCFLSFALGVITVVNTYVSQNLGAGRPRNGPKYAWAAFWLGLCVWVLVMVPYGLSLPWMFRDLLPLFASKQFPGHSPELIRLESGFAQILVFGSIFLLISRGVNQFFFGLHRPRVVTVAAIAGNIVNALGNYVFIFGENGIPGWHIPGIPGMKPHGVFGSAMSTVIGTMVELSIPASIFLGSKLNAELNTRSAWRPRWDTMRDLLKIGWPASIQWGNELVCWAIFMTILVGSFGDKHMAACAIAFGYMSLSFMPAVGFSVATNSLVGKYIGAGKPEVAIARTRLTLALAMIYMTTCAAVFVIFRYRLIGWFTKDEEIIRIGARLLICTAVFQTADAIGVIYTGALRGAGDTIWPGVMTVIYSWVFIVAGGWLIRRYCPGLESVGPWMAAAVYIIIYGLTMWRRFAGGHWKSIRLLHSAAQDAAAMAPIIPGPPITDPEAAVEDLAQAYATSAGSGGPP